MSALCTTFLTVSFGIYWWTLKNQKNQNFEKNKNCWRYHHFTAVYQKPQSQGTVLDIPSETEFFVILGIFSLSNPPPPPNSPEKQNFETMKRASADVIILNLCNKKHHMMYAYSDMQCNNFFFYFRPFFAIFPHYWPQKLKSEKMLKTPGDFILLHMCTTNQNHMMYGYWHIKCKGQGFFIILGHFWSSDPPNNPKNQKFKKIK